MSDFTRQKRPQTTSAEYRKMRDRIKARDLIITTFFAFLIVMALIGLLLPLRPKTSAVEKRDLEKWPAFSIAAIWDGSYFDQISTWYADTFPFRETLIKANSAVKGLYGLQGEQIIHNDSAQKDDIPTDDETEAPEDEMTEEEKAAEEAKKAEEAAKKAEEEKEKQIDEESAIGEDGEAINAHAAAVRAKLDHLFAFCESAFPEGQELLIVVTELTASPAAARFIARYGCDAYFRHSRELMFHERRNELRQAIERVGLD